MKLILYHNCSLICGFFDVFQVIWRRKHEDHPLGVGRFTFTGDTRISVQFDERSGNWSLVISEVKPSDDGVYVCQISTKPVKSYDIRLNVKGKCVS